MGNQKQAVDANHQTDLNESGDQGQKGNPMRKDQPRDQAQQLRDDQGLGRQQAPHNRDQIDRDSEQKRVNLG